jgi:hypothetical protein
MKRNNKKALFFMGVSLVLTSMSIYAAYTSNANQFMGAVLALACSLFLGLVAAVDYQSNKSN